MTLPLAPPLRLPTVYQAITMQAPQIQQAQAMHQYVYATYVNPAGALFDIQHWSVFGMVNRTTNTCEGFHMALNKGVCVRHPSVYRMIEVLQEIEAASEHGSWRLARPPKKRKAKYVAADEAISRLTTTTFGAGILPNVAQMLHYVDAVSYQLWDVKH